MNIVNHFLYIIEKEHLGVYRNYIKLDGQVYKTSLKVVFPGKNNKQIKEVKFLKKRTFKAKSTLTLMSSSNGCCSSSLMLCKGLCFKAPQIGLFQNKAKGLIYIFHSMRFIGEALFLNYETCFKNCTFDVTFATDFPGSEREFLSINHSTFLKPKQHFQMGRLELDNIKGLKDLTCAKVRNVKLTKLNISNVLIAIENVYIPTRIFYMQLLTCNFDSLIIYAPVPITIMLMDSNIAIKELILIGDIELKAGLGYYPKAPVLKEIPNVEKTTKVPLKSIDTLDQSLKQRLAPFINK